MSIVRLAPATVSINQAVDSSAYSNKDKLIRFPGQNGKG